MESLQRRMPHPIPPYKVNYQQHQQGSADQNGNGDLQSDLEVVKI